MYLAKYFRQKIVKRKKNHCIVVFECNFFLAIKTILFGDPIKIKSKQFFKHNFQLI
jgi:hypothetical protein